MKTYQRFKHIVILKEKKKKKNQIDFSYLVRDRAPKTRSEIDGTKYRDTVKILKSTPCSECLKRKVQRKNRKYGEKDKDRIKIIHQRHLSNTKNMYKKFLPKILIRG